MKPIYGDPFGPFAMILCELGQVRKEATAADDSCAGVWLEGLPPNPLFSITYTKIKRNCYNWCYMLATNIPYLYCRNGIYYYRNNTVWKSFKTRCKKTASRKLSITLFGTPPVIKDTSITVNDSSSTQADTKTTLNYSSSTTSLFKAYLAENGDRWCAREYTRIKSALSFLPKGNITKETAIELNTSIN